MRDTVEQKISMPRNLISGAWQDAQESEGRFNVDPNTGTPLHAMATTAPRDVERALASAAALHNSGVWQDVDESERAALLDDIADGLATRVEDIAFHDSMTSGVPISTTRAIAGFIPGRFRAAAEVCRSHPVSEQLEADGRDVRLLRLPWGPAAVLTPWNAPSFIAASKIASALAAGCPVVFKPSESAASTAGPIAEAVAEVISRRAMPMSIFQVVHGTGDVGAAIAGDPRIKVICFTGGSGAGRSIARAASEHFTVLQLELGGNNPVLVLDDADAAATAESLAHGMTLLNGQWCEGPGKVLVHRDVAEDFVGELTDRLREVKIGHSLDESTMLGPLVHSAHRDLVAERLDALRQKGARLITPVAPPVNGGSYLGPTIAVGADPSAATAELFGPAVSVHVVESNSEALHHANATPSGLTATVYGGNTTRAMDIAARVGCGEIRVNGIHLDDLGAGSAQSFWGQSGLGGHGPEEPLRVFRGHRVVGVDSEDLVI